MKDFKKLDPKFSETTKVWNLTWSMLITIISKTFEEQINVDLSFVLSEINTFEENLIPMIKEFKMENVVECLFSYYSQICYINNEVYTGM